MFLPDMCLLSVLMFHRWSDRVLCLPLPAHIRSHNHSYSGDYAMYLVLPKIRMTHGLLVTGIHI